MRFALLGNQVVNDGTTAVETPGATGLSNSEISEELSVSESTVTSHVRSTLARLGLRNRVQLVILTYRLGLAGRRQAGEKSGRATAKPNFGLAVQRGG
jgi:hypothetical protein